MAYTPWLPSQSKDIPALSLCVVIYFMDPLNNICIFKIILVKFSLAFHKDGIIKEIEKWITWTQELPRARWIYLVKTINLNG